MDKLGRNDLCSCGSGKKYKKCCLRASSHERAASSPTPEPRFLESSEGVFISARHARAGAVSIANSLSGFVKLRLGHSTAGGSILLPELLFLPEPFLVTRCGWRFFQPIFFGHPELNFHVKTNLHSAQFEVNIGRLGKSECSLLIIQIQSDGFVRRYNDGAQLYRCIIKGPDQLETLNAGTCNQRSDDDFDLNLFHITNPTARDAIIHSEELRSSKWNLQGTRKLENVAYVYLTNMSGIKSEEDLQRIAMSTSGVIYLRMKLSDHQEKFLKIPVYRESTTGRTAVLPVKLASSLLSPPHVIMHLARDDVHYEVVHPEIYRVGLQPRTALSYVNGVASVDEVNSKIFDYVILGERSTKKGILAPYDEEQTDQVVHVEQLDKGLDLFDFWLKNQNSDQISGRYPEARIFSA